MLNKVDASQNHVVQKNFVSEDHKKQREQLEEACRQFEGVLLSQIWKNMLRDAKRISGRDEKRPFGAMEDLSVEMSAEALSKQNGVGLWKVLYNQLASSLESDASPHEE
ncbi:MAG TPA: hypothetical protein DEP01_08450 [Aminobacterium sp.]|jgi:flagellar protein FlgJ|uniref:hypothetical protein n=1 Tax=Aminobacterium TaxID=81466 RepID=UPI0004665EFA|nr:MULTISPECIES: hypothetical protein [Aminobacterium]HCA41490.1 hypothetical protein [Aminobacterium sp.]